jgi:hypothetical protein
MALRTLTAFAILTVLSLSTANAQWGDLSGTFVYDGDPPTPSPVLVTKDQAFCGKHELFNESLTVNPANKGIQGIVVYLYQARGGAEVKVHPSYEESAKGEVRIDNVGCRFEPHVVAMRTSQTLVVGNKDDVGHNTKIDTVKNVPINPIIPSQSEIKQPFPKEERLPVRISCSIHPWMGAILVIKDSPYMAVTDQDGKFTIANLPEGPWEFQVWQEKSGYIDSVKLAGKATKWNKGRFEHTVAAGDNDLGQILVPPASFK